MSHPQQPQGPFPQPPTGGSSMWGSQLVPQPQMQPAAPEPSWGLEPAGLLMPTAPRSYQPPPPPEAPAGLGAGFWPGAAAGSATTLGAVGFVAMLSWAFSSPAPGTKGNPLPAPTNLLAAVQVIKERQDQGLPPPVFAPPPAADDGGRFKVIPTGPPAAAPPAKVEPPVPPPAAKGPWDDVGGSALASGTVAVDLVDVRLGSAKMVGFRGKVSTSAAECLVFRVKVSNHSQTKKINFPTWGATFKDFNHGEKGTLVDEHGNTYRRLTPPLGEVYQGQPEGEAIAPGGSLVDVLVFEAPIPASKELRLTLPGDNVGVRGTDLRLKIATAAVKPLD